MNIRVCLSCSITSIQSLFHSDSSFWNYLNVDYSAQATRIQNTETVPSEISESHIHFFPQGSCDYDCKKGYILKHELKQKRMHQIMLRFIIFLCCPINNNLHIVHHTTILSLSVQKVLQQHLNDVLGEKEKEKISNAMNWIVKHCIFLDRTHQ